MGDFDFISSFDAAVERGDEAAIRAVLAPDWEEIPTAYPGQPSGPDGCLPVVRAFNAAVPNGCFTIHGIIEAPPKYTVRTGFTGTHRREFLGRAATGLAIRFDTIDIHEARGRQIIRSWHSEDFAAFFRQLDQ